jgi:hypothetical protein
MQKTGHGFCSPYGQCPLAYQPGEITVIFWNRTPEMGIKRQDSGCYHFDSQLLIYWHDDGDNQRESPLSTP